MSKNADAILEGELVMKKGDKVRINVCPSGQHGHAEVRRPNGKVTHETVDLLRDGQEIPPGRTLVNIDNGVVTGSYTRPGPPRVSNEKFRNGWNGVFGSKPDAGLN